MEVLRAIFSRDRSLRLDERLVETSLRGEPASVAVPRRRCVGRHGKDLLVLLLRLLEEAGRPEAVCVQRPVIRIGQPQIIQELSFLMRTSELGNMQQ